MEVVCKSFKACGIAVKSDRSEDREIFCLKSSGGAEDASVESTRQTAALSDATAEDNNLDPFADMEDEEQLESNDVIVEDYDDGQDYYSTT